MPRYFFDIHDDGLTRDDEGIELPDAEAARREAIQALPEIAASEIGQNGDRRHFAVLVTDEEGQPVYSATLAFTGLWLRR